MASISTNKNGSRRLQFIDKARKRRILYLGRVSVKTAEVIKLRVESLVTAALMNTQPDRPTAEWVAEISDEFAAKLAKFGLIAPRRREESRQLGVFLAASITAAAGIKPSTVLSRKQTHQNLIEYFGAERDIASITPEEASEFKAFLAMKQLSASTLARRLSNCRSYFEAAVAQNLCQANPFEGVRAKSGRSKNPQVYVREDTIEQVLEYCSPSLRLMVVLSRYGGLRCPSEAILLRWSDIDWRTRRLTIRSPKTEHHDGMGAREAPLFPRVAKELTDALASARADSEYVLAIDERFRNGRARYNDSAFKALRRAIRKSGLKPWAKLFNSLRGSCETDLVAEGHPIQSVTAWLGNSPAVALKHYLKVRDEDFKRAAEGETTHMTTQSLTVSDGQGSSGNERTTTIPNLPLKRRVEQAKYENRPQSWVDCGLSF